MVLYVPKLHQRMQTLAGTTAHQCIGWVDHQIRRVRLMRTVRCSLRIRVSVLVVARAPRARTQRSLRRQTAIVAHPPAKKQDHKISSIRPPIRIHRSTMAAVAVGVVDSEASEIAQASRCSSDRFVVQSVHTSCPWHYLFN